MKARGRSWTADDDAVIVAMTERGKSFREIGDAIGRHRSAVMLRYFQMTGPANYRAWTSEEYAALRGYVLDGRSMREIRELMPARTERAIKDAMTRLGIRLARSVEAKATLTGGCAPIDEISARNGSEKMRIAIVKYCRKYHPNSAVARQFI